MQKEESQNPSVADQRARSAGRTESAFVKVRATRKTTLAFILAGFHVVLTLLCVSAAENTYMYMCMHMCMHM